VASFDEVWAAVNHSKDFERVVAQFRCSQRSFLRGETAHGDMDWFFYRDPLECDGALHHFITHLIQPGAMPGGCDALWLPLRMGHAEQVVPMTVAQEELGISF